MSDKEIMLLIKCVVFIISLKATTDYIGSTVVFILFREQVRKFSGLVLAVSWGVYYFLNQI